MHELLENGGEDEVSSILSSFCCSMNHDIEDFARNKALEFNKQGIASTYLVFSYGESAASLEGFYTLAFKVASVSREGLSKATCKRLSKFSEFNADGNRYLVPAILIAQFGKNDNSVSGLTGSELMALALGSVREVQERVGGRFVFLECENVPKLLSFYEGEGFVKFGLRQLGPEDESAELHELVQLFRFVRN